MVLGSTASDSSITTAARADFSRLMIVFFIELLIFCYDYKTRDEFQIWVPYVGSTNGIHIVALLRHQCIDGICQSR